MIAIIATLLAFITGLMHSDDTISIEYIPAIETNSVRAYEIEYEKGCDCFECYWTECFEESLNKFDELFNSYEVKRARNGAMMIRSGNSGSYTFAKKGK